jgi:hypothetical protein
MAALGLFDYWGCPWIKGETVIALVERLRRAGIPNRCARILVSAPLGLRSLRHEINLIPPARQEVDQDVAVFRPPFRMVGDLEVADERNREDRPIGGRASGRSPRNPPLVGLVTKAKRLPLSRCSPAPCSMFRPAALRLSSTKKRICARRRPSSETGSPPTKRTRL